MPTLDVKELQDEFEKHSQEGFEVGVMRLIRRIDLSGSITEAPIFQFPSIHDFTNDEEEAKGVRHGAFTGVRPDDRTNGCDRKLKVHSGHGYGNPMPFAWEGPG